MYSRVLYIIAATAAAVVIYAITKTKHPLRTALKSAAGGTMALLFVNLTSSATGCYIAINFFTVTVATVLSLPGVVGMLLLNVIFI